MAIFVWKGKNRMGDVVGGERVAKSAIELTRILHREQITVINIKRKSTELKIPFLKREKVTLKELAVFSRQLSVLIDADLPLIQGLNMMAQQTKNNYFKNAITRVRKDVEAGSTLNQALKNSLKSLMISTATL